MRLYFWIIRIAAFFGHKKARKMVEGQKAVFSSQLSDFKGAIWFHAASVGEFEQARPIIERLKNTESKDQVCPKIVVTFFSPSGYEMRKNYELADAVLYLPFATRRNAKWFIETLQPQMAIFVKYEFWPAYLRELKQHAIPTYSICAIFREKQYLFQWWGKKMLDVLRCFTHIFVQDEASQTLLAAHGVTNVSVAGDTRFDRMIAVKNTEHSVQNTDRLTPIAQFVENTQHIIVAGSTWPKDEELLAKFMGNTDRCTDRIQSTDLITKRTKLILVPHEIDEDHLHFIFNQFQGRFVRYSDVQRDNVPCTKESIRNILQHADVMVVDTMGLLSSIYRLGQVAYIGGGFGVGIHNTIEAAAYGMPVIFGPNYHHFREAKELIAAGAARSINNAEELTDALQTALEQHEAIGAKAAQYVQSELGATDRIYNSIFNS